MKELNDASGSKVMSLRVLDHKMREKGNDNSMKKEKEEQEKETRRK